MSAASLDASPAGAPPDLAWLRRGWWVVVVCMVVGAVGGLLLASVQTKTYESKTTVLVTPTSVFDGTATPRINDVNMDNEIQIVRSVDGRRRGALPPAGRQRRPTSSSRRSRSSCRRTPWCFRSRPKRTPPKGPLDAVARLRRVLPQGAGAMPSRLPSTDDGWTEEDRRQLAGRAHSGRRRTMTERHCQASADADPRQPDLPSQPAHRSSWPRARSTQGASSTTLGSPTARPHRCDSCTSRPALSWASSSALSSPMSSAVAAVGCGLPPTWATAESPPSSSRGRSTRSPCCPWDGRVTCSTDCAWR